MDNVKKGPSVDSNSFTLPYEKIINEVQGETNKILEVIHSLAIENTRLQNENEFLKYSFNKMYLVMQHVWERLGFKSGTWEGKLDKVRLWATKPRKTQSARFTSEIDNT